MSDQDNWDFASAEDAKAEIRAAVAYLLKDAAGNDRGDIVRDSAIGLAPDPAQAGPGRPPPGRHHPRGGRSKGSGWIDALQIPSTPRDSKASADRSCLWNVRVAPALAWKGDCKMPASYPAQLLLATMLLLMAMPAFAQSGGGGGGGSSGGSSGGASSGGAAGGASSGASGVGTGATAGAPNAGSAGAGNTAINGVRGTANPAGPNNSGNDPSGAGNAANTQNQPGTNSAGTASSSGSPSGNASAPLGSTTVGTAGNRAGGATGGRIDGTVTSGPRLPGDDAIKSEDAQDSKVDKKIKSICRGC
jgi:hypothetical protein